MKKFINRSLARVLSVLMMVSALFAGLTAFGIADNAYAVSGLVFSHEGEYELELDAIDSSNPPGPVKGDKLSFGGKNYTYDDTFATVGFFEDGGYDEICDQTAGEFTLERKWNDNQDFASGKTVYFKYILSEVGGSDVYSSNDIAVKIKSDAPDASLKYEPKTTGRTLDRAYAKGMTGPMLSNAFTEKGDKVTVTVGSSSTEYTFDGNIFSTAANDGELEDVATKYGLEWCDEETFEGATASYHFWATIKGTKVVSNDITVNLTGEAKKEVKSFKFVPANKYQMVVGETANPPKERDGDKIVVAYDDYSTDIFTFDTNGTQGADFYAENGKNLASVLTDDLEAAWKTGQTFNVGDTPEFVYYAGSMRSNAVKVEIIAAPAPVTVSSIRFIHGGEYEMEAVESPSVPLAVSGDLFEVKYSDGTTEYFVYDETQGAFISPSTKQDIESKGTLSAAWNKDQEFKPGTICYFTYALTAGSNTVRTQNISVKFTGTEPTPTPTPAVVSVTVNTKTVNAKALNAAIAKAGVSADSVTTIVLGKKVKKIKKGAFKNFRNAKTLVVKTKKLKKSRVKNSLKGSKINNVKVKVGNKKTNKKYVKKYKKIFKKKNSGRKVKVSL